ncbi:hypothetical protein KEM56_005175 [Ascosphaera pollenicola]|nr:hypothetical protein KEM56_005175 [Ascosphaera pollenicola]
MSEQKDSPSVSPKTKLEDDQTLHSVSAHFRRGFEELTDVTRKYRSSFVASDLNNVPDNEIPDRKAMACFVHYLLDLPNLAPERIRDISTGLADPDVGAQAVQATDVLNHTIDYAKRASRLMNRRQLAELVWNVRSLSKELGSINLKLDINNILVVTKPQDSSLVTLTWKVARSLLMGTQSRNTLVYVEARLKDHPLFHLEELYSQEPTAKERLKFWQPDFLCTSPDQIDFVVTLGGDGTVLHTSNLFQEIVPPVLSFSLGSLGFLTKFRFDEYESSLDRVFNDGVHVSLRLRFECTVMRSKPLPEEEARKGEERDLQTELIGSLKDCPTHEAAQAHQILNDVVVDRGPHPTMSTTEVFGDNEYFTQVQADGICIATPTGSTAYSLAAGGSLCHPENPVILLTAICAHTLNFRPLILPDSIQLHIGVPYNARTSSWASFDGRNRTEIQPGDYVSISASRYPFAVVSPSENRSREWIKSISSTLHWNERRRQRPFDAEKDLDAAYERGRKSSRTSE